MKRSVPLLITAIGGFVLIVAYFIPYTQSWGESVAVWFDILASIAFILGGGNLLKLHLKKVSDRVPGWGYSLIVLVAFLSTLAIGLGKIGVSPLAQFPDFAWSGHYREMGSPFWFFYQYGFQPLTATMFAMLAFYIASAAFRAFRAKNLEAVLLLGTAFIILLGRFQRATCGKFDRLYHERVQHRGKPGDHDRNRSGHCLGLAEGIARRGPFLLGQGVARWVTSLKSSGGYRLWLSAPWCP
jgi:hypothetical protein